MTEDYPPIQNPGLPFYVDRINRRELFTFSRWGDGEWRAALGRRSEHHVNCDKHPFYPAMNELLAQVLKSRPKYEMGIQGLALRCYGNGIRSFIAQHCPDTVWYEADVFHKASCKGQLRPLLQAIQNIPLLLVGPAYLKRGHALLKFSEFVEVPQKNCFLRLNTLYDHTLMAAKRMPKPFLLSISASMPAEILLDRLYPHLKESAFLIDFGSMYDPFVNNNTRKYHKAMAPEIRTANLEGLL